ncbi:MAG: hypothetical protein KKB31_05110, partial [Nanoarchaeota archaeon]|nr:hypothetical protein [Nanoarchaeota archaeon]
MRGPHTEKTKKIMSLKKKGKPCDFIKTKFKKGHIPWNKYLTKETDERLAYLEFLGFKKGHKTWNKNLTKEIDERIKN